MNVEHLAGQPDQIAAAIKTLTAAGLPVSLVVGQPANGTPTVPAARPQPKPAPLLRDAVRLCLEAKSQQNLRERYLSSLESYLQRFAARFVGMTVADVTTELLEEWFKERGEPPSSRNANRGRLSALFSFSKRRGWLWDNPCDCLERPRLERKAPEILSPEQAELLLKTVRQHWPDSLAHVVLLLLAGVRPDEALRLRWDDIRLDGANPTVTISAAASKVRQRRIVKLMPSAVAWLRLGGKLPISRMTRKRLVWRMRQTLSFEDWPRDILRHTAASYLLAHTESPGRVSMMLGNSEKILRVHYVELVTAEDATKFWAIMPLP